MKIISWNVNGLRAVAKKGFLEWFNKEQPDILAIQETKLQPEQVPKILNNLEGYHIEFVSGVKKGYSGVALYSKLKPIEIHKGFGIEKFDNEGRIVRADYKDFTLINIYYPNGQSSEERLAYKMEFYDAFLHYVDKLVEERKNLVICGDLNTAHREIDLARPKANEKTSGFLPMERAWIDKFLSHSYIDTFREFNKEGENYTWWSYRSAARSRNVGWRLDYFFVNRENMKNVKKSYILPDVMGSDHCPVVLEYEINNGKN